jgi:hypothetical protein
MREALLLQLGPEGVSVPRLRKGESVHGEESRSRPELRKGGDLVSYAFFTVKESIDCPRAMKKV